MHIFSAHTFIRLSIVLQHSSCITTGLHEAIVVDEATVVVVEPRGSLHEVHVVDEAAAVVVEPCSSPHGC